MTTRAASTSRTSRINEYTLPTACDRLVGQHAHKRIPRSIMNVLAKTMILDHVLYEKILDHDVLVLECEPVRALVQEIITLITDTQVHS